MITVQMTMDILNRPPKILGLFTKKQLIGLLIAGAVAVFLLAVIPGMFAVKLLIASFSALPIVVIAFFPEGESSPLSFLKFYTKTIFRGTTLVKHNGNSTFYKKQKTEQVKIRRHDDYIGRK